MNRDAGEIFCEACGSPTATGAVFTHYCVECGLYVCSGCWSSSGRRCRTCAGSMRRRRGGSLQAARRADRRLREATREAAAIVVAGVAQERYDAWAHHACLTIKVDTAERAGMRALGRLTGAGLDRVRPLADRIRRHARGADGALARAASALTGFEARDSPVALVAAIPGTASANETRSNLRAVLAGSAAFMIIGVLIAAVWLNRPLGSPSSREGTLAADELRASMVTRPSTPTPREGQGAVGLSQEQVLTFDFNDARMGSGIGADWRQTAGGADVVALAPFPTAVNRSARLESIGGAGAEACRSFSSPTVRVTRLMVDVLLPEATAMAVVSAGPTSGDSEVRLSLATSGTSVMDGGRVLAEGTGLDAGAWYRSEIALEGERTLWRVAQLGGPEEPIFESAVDIGALERVGEVCLAVSEGSEGRVHFDNLTIATIEEGMIR